MKKPKQFVLEVVLDLLLEAGATSVAQQTEFLIGWTVVKGGSTVCTDPYV